MNVTGSLIYKEFVALKEEVSKHKWYESERAGYDIGWAQALMSWTLKHKSQWIKERPNRLKNYNVSNTN